MLWVRDYTDSDDHPQILRAGPHGRQVFRFLCRLSGRYELNGKIPDEYLDPTYLVARIGMRCCEGCPVPTTTHAADGVTALLLVGLLVRNAVGVTEIDGWERRQPRAAKSNAQRQREFRERSNEKVTARNAPEKRREEKRREDQKTPSAAPTARGPAPQDAVIEAWRRELGKDPTLPVPDAYGLIGARLKERFTLEQLCLVPVGARIDAERWPERATANEFKFLFGSAGQVRKFIELAEKGNPAPKARVVDVRRGLQRSEDQGWTDQNYVDPEKFKAELAASK